MRAFLSAGHGPTRDLRYQPGYSAPANPNRLLPALSREVLAGAGKMSEHVLADWIIRECARDLETVEPFLVPRLALNERIAFVNRWSSPGDIAIEVHLNSAGADGRPHGVETFYAAGSDKGRQLAACLHASLVKIGRPPRGPKPDTDSGPGSLNWCRRTQPWAALVEVAFMSNPGELEWLLKTGGREAGEALAKGIESWP